MLPQLWFFLSIAYSSIYLAGTPPPATGRSVAAFADPAQLPLHRVGIPGSRCRVTRTAACLRAFGGLWGHHCGNACVAFTAIPAQCGWRCRRMDLQPLGFSRYSQRFLPSQSRRTIGGAVGSRILPSDVDSTAAADHARTRFPNSSAASTGTRNARKPAPSMSVAPGPFNSRRIRPSGNDVQFVGNPEAMARQCLPNSPVSRHHAHLWPGDFRAVLRPLRDEFSNGVRPADRKRYAEYLRQRHRREERCARLLATRPINLTPTDAKLVGFGLQRKEPSLGPLIKI